MAKKDNPWDNDGVWNSVSDEVRKFKVLNGGASNNWGGYVKYGFLLLLVLVKLLFLRIQIQFQIHVFSS